MATTSDIRPDSTTPWLTKRDAAARARVSVDLISRAVRRGELRVSHRAGRRVLIHVDWLDAWLESREAR